MGYYEVALICKNGHVINSRARSSPECNSNYCDKCGEQTIQKCEGCGSSIRGRYVLERVVDFFTTYLAPSYCHECGRPYPWQEKKLKALEEALQLNEELSNEEKQEFIESAKDIITDNPRTQIGVLKIQRLLKKIGKGASDMFYNLIIDIASETAKKMFMDQR